MQCIGPGNYISEIPVSEKHACRSGEVSDVLGLVLQACIDLVLSTCSMFFFSDE